MTETRGGGKRPEASLLFDNTADENERKVCHSRPGSPFMKVRRDGERKAEPIGDNTRVLHGARPQAIEGSTPPSSADLTKMCP